MGVLAASRRSIHLDRDLESMPEHRCRFGKMVVDDDANVIALVHLDRWARSAAVVTPEVNYTSWNNLLLNRLGDEMEFLHASVHTPRELRNIGRFDRNDLTVASLAGMAS